MFRDIYSAPIDHALERELPVMGEIHSIDSLRERFVPSDWGARLAANPPRYESHIWEDREAFVEVFGADIDPMQHGPYQARTVAIPAVDAQISSGHPLQLSEEEVAHFVAYHVVHDDHEGETGDMQLPQKTAESDKEEMLVWEKMMRQLHGGDVAGKLIDYAWRFADKDGDYLAKFWDVTERIGYVATGVHAWHVYNSVDNMSDHDRQKTSNMASDVCSRSMLKIEQARDEIVFADVFMTAVTGTIKQVATHRGHSYKDFMNGAGLVH